MCLAVDDTIALLNHRAADRLRQMALPGAWWSEKEVLSLSDEAARRELVDQRPIHFLVEIKIEGIERAIRIAEARLFVPALEEAILPAQDLVGHEYRHEIVREDRIVPGTAQRLFSRRFAPAPSGLFGSDFLPATHGSRFLVRELIESAPGSEIRAIVNWPRLLKQAQNHGR